jgi:hypothetical protein
MFLVYTFYCYVNYAVSAFSSSSSLKFPEAHLNCLNLNIAHPVTLLSPCSADVSFTALLGVSVNQSGPGTLVTPPGSVTGWKS